MKTKKYEQSKSMSFTEALSSALISAPTAILLHMSLNYGAGKIGIDITGGVSLPIFSVIVWFMFFLHSVAFRYFTRRFYERHGVQLEWKNLKKKCSRLLVWSRNPPFHGGNAGSNPVGNAKLAE